MASEPRCWCGSTELKPFSPDYLVCGDCRTLVAAAMPGAEIAHIDDEERDFYGRRYWFEYQERELGNPDITVRARRDLPERCVYWLRTVLHYQRPPARTLDVGCGHGALVMLLNRAGFEASGLELSPWVVDFARRTFRVPILLGPLESQSLSPGSLDVITMMDVLEHLTDPTATLAAAVAALGENGLLMIQTPAVPPDLSWEEMVAANHPFLPLMAERGHLYLFNEASLERLIVERIGVRYLRFEPAYFGAYDMFVIASRRPLRPQVSSAVAQALSDTPDGRLVQALLDLDTGWSELRNRYEDVERDRRARLAALLDHGDRLRGAEGERNALSAEVHNLREYLAVTEADRAARLVVIRDQSERLTAAEADRAARLAVIEDLSQRLAASEQDRADRLAIIQELSEGLAASEQDRADRLAVIQELSEGLAASEQDRADRLALVETLSAQLTGAEADRTARLTVIEEQQQTLAELHRRVDEIERDRVAQAARLEALAAERHAIEAQLASLRFRGVRVMMRNLLGWLRTVSRG